MCIEVMKLALDALEHHGGHLPWNAFVEVRKDLRTAIQQAESEPVGAREALERIASWSEHPAMLAVDYGSNGVRDYYRKIASDALTHPAPGVPDDGWVSVDERIPRIDGETNYIGVNSAGFMCVFNALMGTKCPNSGRVFWHCDMETAEESIRMMSGLAYWRKAPSLAASPAQKGGE